MNTIRTTPLTFTPIPLTLSRTGSPRGEVSSLQSVVCPEPSPTVPDPALRRLVLNKLDWQHRWHTDFLYEDHAMPLLPKGTVVVLTSYFDNTSDNPHNPDPDQVVVFGRRSVDEMSHVWIGRTFFEQEEFDQLVVEREQYLKTSGAAAEAGN